ncbi:DNA alkylation repair protein [Desulfolutivibrio sulfoxidireducens]|uniref:DNA alkylation repair protein n=1 Tax=Desulfolutivibrio sulfoxidireducens TaxID=2773299 RepID=UPI00159E4520|nr:DNA alkylation repair protein [Desulfolutivibrio sulfoxidireducens]QLA15947.1 DNA alkylation repair protein [Desulfolutivibrio sulfoxidireducens]
MQDVQAVARDIAARIRAAGSEHNRQGMARYGINVAHAAGVSVAVVRGIRKEIGQDHELALVLWDTGLHEARLLACLTADSGQTDDALLERWAADLDSWDICDMFTNNLARKTAAAHDKARAWAGRPEEFVRRAGFSLVASLAVHDKNAPDERFLGYLGLVEATAHDGRNFVKKAVNWALRGIGKRNEALRLAAMDTARRVLAQDTPQARWIARDAIRELSARGPR